MGEIAPRGKKKEPDVLEKEIERLKAESKKDFSDYFGRYQKLVKENDILTERLTIKNEAHKMACGICAKIDDDYKLLEKKFTDYKENLLLKAEQYEREQEYFIDNAPEDLEYNKAVLTGVTRIVSLIRRFNEA